MVTKAKAAPAKAAPAPAVEEVGSDEITIGRFVEFQGYGDDVPEADQVLVAGEQYEVVNISEDEGTPGTEDFIEGGNAIVSAPNPAFNPKKKEHPDTNPKTVEVEVFAEEIVLVEEEPAGEVIEEVVEEVVEEVAPAPAPAPKGKAAVKTPAKAEAAPAAAAKPAAKTTTKPAAKTPAKAAVKPAKVTAAPVEEAEVIDPDALPDLENEDAEVLALIEGDVDRIAVAQELEQTVGSAEYKLGGVLFHIKKDKTHLSIVGDDNKPVAAYAEKGGFAQFMKDFFNIDYRKAMYLIEIYVNFTQAQIPDAAAVVARLGWTKASKIARPLVAEGANAEELIELADTSTVADLTEVIKDQARIGGTSGEKVERVTMKFRYLSEEGATNLAIITAAQEQQGLKNIDEALSFILTDWSTAQAGGAATAQSAPVQAAAVAKPAVKAVAKRTAVAAK